MITVLSFLINRRLYSSSILKAEIQVMLGFICRLSSSLMVKKEAVGSSTIAFSISAVVSTVS